MSDAEKRCFADAKSSRAVHQARRAFLPTGKLDQQSIARILCALFTTWFTRFSLGRYDDDQKQRVLCNPLPVQSLPGPGRS